MAGEYAFLKERTLMLEQRIDAAARAAARSASEISVLAVSKTVNTDAVRAAVRAGYTLFGENRPQELVAKREELDSDEACAGIDWHMIGNLQTNKINQVLTRASLIHSVSSTHLASAIDKRAAQKGLMQPVLLEVNVSGEESKSGFSPVELEAALDELMDFEALEIRGLMTMGAAGDEPRTRKAFAGLYELAEKLRHITGLPLEILSYGMSDDFEIAVEEGSNMLRLGRCIFEKDYYL